MELKKNTDSTKNLFEIENVIDPAKEKESERNPRIPHSVQCVPGSKIYPHESEADELIFRYVATRSRNKMADKIK